MEKPAPCRRSGFKHLDRVLLCAPAAALVISILGLLLPPPLVLLASPPLSSALSPLLAVSKAPPSLQGEKNFLGLEHGGGAQRYSAPADHTGHYRRASAAEARNIGILSFFSVFIDQVRYLVS